MADANAGPFENIAFRGWLRRKDEPENVAEIRMQVALRYRDLAEGAQVSALKAQKYEPSTGRPGVPAPVGDHVIDCMKTLKRISRDVPPSDMEALEDVIIRDVWIWEGKSGGAIRKEVDRVLHGLDHMAIALGYVTAEAVTQRWPSSTKKSAASRRVQESA